jgi:hypothetical protein
MGSILERQSRHHVYQRSRPVHGPRGSDGRGEVDSC